MTSAAGRAPAGPATHRKGFVLTLAGVLLLTPDTLLVRLTAIDDMLMAVWRGAIGGAVVLVGCAFYYRGGLVRQALGLGRWGLLVAALFGASGIAFYAALERTSVANVLVVLATTPLIGAVLARVFLGERIAAATALAIAGAAVGLVVVAAPGLESGHYAGDALALGNAALIAAAYTVIRRHHEVNMIPATGLGLLLGAALALPLATLAPLSPAQWLWMGLGGAVVIPGAFALLTLGPRYLPVPEVAMLMLLETVLGPLWVWMAIGERPAAATLAGGGLVLATLAAHSTWRLSRGAPVPG